MLSLLRLERKQTNSSNLFRIRIFLFLSYSFGIETINTFIHSVVPSKTIPDSRPKWAKCIRPVFRPKRRKNPTRWCATYLYSLYKGVPPRESRGNDNLVWQPWQFDYVWKNFLPNYTFLQTDLFVKDQKNSTRNQVDEEPLCGCTTSNHYLFIICYFILFKHSNVKQTYK